MKRSLAQGHGPAFAAATMVGAFFLAASVRAADDADQPFEVYGYAQADFIADIGGRLDPDWDDTFRTSMICLDGACGGDGQTSLSVKQSRIGVKGTVPTGANTAPFDFKLEFDLFGTGEHAGQTTFRMRHAYAVWGQFLAGQTDSLFMDGDVFPNTLDYWGPPGAPGYRNPQLRWTPWRTDTSHLAFAIERPSNDIDPGNLRLIEGFEELQVQNDEEFPDLTVQYRLGGDWGHAQLGGLLRKVGFELSRDGTNWVDGSETGWGLSVATVLNTFDQDKVQLEVVYGEGIASYINDGGMDLAPRIDFGANGELVDVDAEAIPLTGVVAYYEHFWNERWSSAIGYSFTEVDNTNFQDPSTFHKVDYASGNLVYYPADNLMFGAEVLWGKRTNNDGASDDALRVQFTAKFTFGTRL